MNFEIVEGDDVRNSSVEMVELCLVAFERFEPDYLTERLKTLSVPALISARREAGSLAGFKLGYRRGRNLFYSWLGAVHPAERKRGLATALMERQHVWATDAGYQHIETRTRSENNVMISLNLKSGFFITGFEIDPHGFGVVTQRKFLP